MLILAHDWVVEGGILGPLLVKGSMKEDGPIK